MVFALIAVLGTAVVYGTDVFCAMVQRPALAHVDDRALVAVMGNVHRYGDRRMPVPGVLGIGGRGHQRGVRRCVRPLGAGDRRRCRGRPAGGVAGALPVGERADQPPAHRRV